MYEYEHEQQYTNAEHEHPSAHAHDALPRRSRRQLERRGRCCLLLAHTHIANSTAPAYQAQQAVVGTAHVDTPADKQETREAAPQGVACGATTDVHVTDAVQLAYPQNVHVYAGEQAGAVECGVVVWTGAQTPAVYSQYTVLCHLENVGPAEDASTEIALAAVFAGISRNEEPLSVVVCL